MRKGMLLVLLFLASLVHAEEYVLEGNACKIAFPEKPQHIRQKLRMSRGDEVIYDAYISANDQKPVYMVLVAEFPVEVKRESVKKSLEGFLTGMLHNSPSNRLLFANFVNDKRGDALEFLIESENAYFRGRTFIDQKRLFLIAFESGKNVFQEEEFEKFRESFTFMK